MMSLNLRSKSVKLLVEGITTAIIADRYIVGLSLDSRNVSDDVLFIALAVNPEQRIKHINQALSSGSRVILFDAASTLTQHEIDAVNNVDAVAYPIIDLAQNTSLIADRFYDSPSKSMTVLAVTGTNGKTSVSQFIAQALEYLGHPCGVIGTLGVGRINALTHTNMTTPDPVTVQAVLADFMQQDISYVVIEASSHALEQGRLAHVDIDVAMLTNLSRDHLDYHKDMNDYAAAKQKLFEFDSIKTAVINIADQFGLSLEAKLIEQAEVTTICYSSESKLTSAMVQAADIETRLDGIQFKLHTDQGNETINSQLLGRFNVDNLLAALSGLLAIGLPFEQVCKAIEQCKAVDGRMQTYSAKNKAKIVIDFAHTPDALTHVLQSLRSHIINNGSLWCVFGCGGDRDKGKRSLMGQNAEHFSDRVVLTTDNPRTENKQAIVDDILQGISNPQNIEILHDRGDAITYAISHATSNDIVLIAGKGHEQYQDEMGVKTPFNDAQVVKQILAANDESPFLKGANQ